MQSGVLSVSGVPVRVPVSGQLTQGLRLLGREDNSSSVFAGTLQTVTTATGNLIPKGDPATAIPYTVPGSHFSGGSIWLVSDGSSQIVDWSAD